MYTDRQTKLYRRLPGASVAWLSTLALGVVAGCVGAEATDGRDPTSEEAQAQDPGAGSPSPAASAASQEAPPIAAGSCSTGTENGGHTAVGRCSGFTNTGTFRVLTTCCLSHCDNGPIGGSVAFLAGGTSTAGCGSAFATDVQIQFGPPGG